MAQVDVANTYVSVEGSLGTALKLESVQVLDSHCSLRQYLFTSLLLKLVSQQEKWEEGSKERFPKHHLTPLRSSYAYGPRNTPASCWGAFAKEHHYMETEVWACLICECRPGQLPHFWEEKASPPWLLLCLWVQGQDQCVQLTGLSHPQLYCLGEFDLIWGLMELL